MQQHMLTQLFCGRRAAQRKLARTRQCSSCHSGHHVSTKIHLFFNFSRVSSLRGRVLSGRGVSVTGTKTVYTKGRLKKKIKTHYSTQTNTFFKCALSLSVIKDSSSVRNSVLFIFADGGLRYLPQTSRLFFGRLQLASDVCSSAIARGASSTICNARFCELALLLKNFSRVC